MARDTIFEKSSGSDSGLSLAVRLQAGSSDAWGDLIRLYGPLVDRWCRSAGVAPSATPDVAQEIFLAAFRGLGQFDTSHPDATFRGWLWTVARNRIVDHHRRNQMQASGRGGSAALIQIESIPDPVPLEEPTEPDHAAALLHRAMDQIRVEFTHSTWDLFWRSTVLGHPTDLIANENGVSSAAVRQAKSRVLRRLRRQLGDQ